MPCGALCNLAVAAEATKESQRALQYHATDLFGSEAGLYHLPNFGLVVKGQKKTCDSKDVMCPFSLLFFLSVGL